VGSAPGDGEKEERGPVYRVEQPREANQLMEVEEEEREVYIRGGGVESRASACGSICVFGHSLAAEGCKS